MQLRLVTITYSTLFVVYDLNNIFLLQKSAIGWILLNLGTMTKILRYLIKVSNVLSNARFLSSFGRLEESTHCTLIGT